jgi:leucyl/phenylalanyl-tRNA--protein transferase
MFTRRPDASKVAFAVLARQLVRWGIHLVDCQVHTDHLARFGGFLVPRTRYLELLAEALRHETRPGAWRLDPEALLEAGR